MNENNNPDNPKILLVLVLSLGLIIGFSVPQNNRPNPIINQEVVETKTEYILTDEQVITQINNVDVSHCEVLNISSSISSIRYGAYLEYDLISSFVFYPHNESIPEVNITSSNSLIQEGSDFWEWFAYPEPWDYNSTDQMDSLNDEMRIYPNNYNGGHCHEKNRLTIYNYYEDTDGEMMWIFNQSFGYLEYFLFLNAYGIYDNPSFEMISVKVLGVEFVE